MFLPHVPFVVLDTETTGLTPRADRVLELAIQRYEGGEKVAEWESLFAVPGEVPPFVQVLTRIRPGDLNDAPNFPVGAQHAAPLLEGAVLVGHNIPFDLRMLKGDGLDLGERPWVDTAMLASLTFPELESWGLSYLSAVLGLPHEPRHRAMGDVHATVALLGKIWERLCALPEDVLTEVKALAEKGPGGYRVLFSHVARLPDGQVRRGATAGKSPGVRRGAGAQVVRRGATAGKSPGVRRGAGAQVVRRGATLWRPACPVPGGCPGAGVEAMQTGMIVEGLSSPGRHSVAPLQTLKDFPDSSARARLSGRQALPTGRQVWFAVKNLHATLRSLDSEALGRFSVIHPPQFLLDPAAAGAFLKQPSFTPAELTLALKLLLFSDAGPRPGGVGALHATPLLFDFPVHSDERDVWKGKLACTGESAAYRRQFEHVKNDILIDHRQLLELPRRGEGPTKGDCIVIDDASMLEDTATKAFRRSFAADALRAAATGNAELTSFLDACQLWIEKVRNFQDIRYLVVTDLASRDARGLRERLDALVGALHATPLRTLIKEHLSDLQYILNPRNLDGRITFIEQFRDGGQIVQSVPLDVAGVLEEVLYDKFKTTLVLPPGERDSFRAFLPIGADVEIQSPDAGFHPSSLRYAEPELTLERLIEHVDGRVVCLVSSKRLIEQLFIAHAEALEARGVTLITQGTSGGVGRMQAEFLAGGDRAVWFLTPWLYEGIELPAGSVDRLWIHTLPFDHPSHAILSKRAERYGDGFNDYYLPRMLHRLFRILRTYGNHRTEDGDVLILDQRVRTKGYGGRVREYLEGISGHS